MVSTNEDVISKLGEINTDNLIDRAEGNMIMKMLSDGCLKGLLIGKLNGDNRLKTQTKHSFENSLRKSLYNNAFSSDDLTLFQCYGVLFLGTNPSDIKWGNKCENTKKLIENIRRNLPPKVLSVYEAILLGYEDTLNRLNNDRKKNTTIISKIHDLISSQPIEKSLKLTHESTIKNVKFSYERFLSDMSKLDMQNVPPEIREKASDLGKRFQKLTGFKLDDVGVFGVIKNSFTDVNWSQNGKYLLEATKGFGKGLYDSTVGFVVFIYDLFDDEKVRDGFLIAMSQLWDYVKENYDDPAIVYGDIVNQIKKEFEKLKGLPPDRQAHVMGEILGNIIGSVIGVKGLSKIKNLSTMKVVMKADKIDQAGAVLGASVEKGVEKIRHIKSWADLESYVSKVERIRFNRMSGEDLKLIISDIKSGNTARIKDLPKVTGLKEKVVELVEYGEALDPTKIESVLYKSIDMTRSGTKKLFQFSDDVLNKLPADYASQLKAMGKGFSELGVIGIDIVDRSIAELGYYLGKGLSISGDFISGKINKLLTTIKSIDFPRKAELMFLLNDLSEWISNVYNSVKKPISSLKSSKEKLHYQGGMAVVESNGKYGFVDPKNKLVVPCKYDNVGSFIDGKAIVELDGRSMIIDKAGNNLLLGYTSPEGVTGSFNKITPLGKGLYIVEDKLDVNIVKITQERTKYGKVVSSRVEQFASLDTSGFTELGGGLKSINKNGKFAVIDETGEAIIPFSESVDSVRHHGGGLLEVTRGNDTLLLNSNNKLKLPKLGEVLQVKDDFILMNNGKKRFIFDRKGTLISETTMKFEKLSYYDKKIGVALIEGSDRKLELVRVKKNGFESISKLNIDSISFTKGDIAVFSNNGEYSIGRITKNGIETIQSTNFAAIDMKNGVIIGRQRGHNGGVSILDIRESKSKKVFMTELAKFDSIDNFVNGNAVVRLNGEYAIVNSKGKPISGCRFGEYDEIIFSRKDTLGLQEGLFKVKKGNKIGVIDVQGNVIIEPMLDDMKLLNDGVIKIYKDGKVGAISYDGTVLLEPEFTNVTRGSNGLINAEINGKSVKSINPEIKTSSTRLFRPKYLAFLTFVQEDLSIMRRNRGLTDILDRDASPVGKLLLRDLNFTSVLKVWSGVSESFLSNFEYMLANILKCNDPSKMGEFVEAQIKKLFRQELPSLKEYVKKKLNLNNFNRVDNELLYAFREKFAQDFLQSTKQIITENNLPNDLGDSQYYKQIVDSAAKIQDQFFISSLS